MKNRNIIKKIKIITYSMTILLIIVSISFGLTYSKFVFKSDNYKAIDMHVNKLDYDIYINDIKTNNISISAGNTVLNIKIKSNNGVSTYYKFLYLNNPSINIYYIDDITFGSINSNEEKEFKLFVSNNSSNIINIEFNVSGGYINNSLSDVIVDEEYNEITSQIKVGDYIDYFPNGVIDLTSFEINSEESGYKDIQNVYLEDSKYRILNINDDGSIDIISEKELYIDSNENGLFLSSYDSGIILLDQIVNKLYGRSEYAIKARNMNINDIINNLKDNYELITNDIENYYSLNLSKETFNSEVYYDLLIDNKKNWLSSNYIKNKNKVIYYGIYSISNNNLVFSDLKDSLNNYNSYSNCIRPIITLRSDINLKYEDLTWKIK